MNADGAELAKFEAKRFDVLGSAREFRPCTC